MDDAVLFTADPPGLHLLAVDESPLADLITRWAGAHPECAIRRVRGQQSADVAGFTAEVAAALQFPYYYGKNWDAFADCIQDLNWFPEASFLVIFSRADLLLASSDRDFKILLETLADTNGFWRGQTAEIGGEKQPIRFQSLLACPDEALPALTRRLQGAGVGYSRL